jgi:TetR/AcrR family transcriptional repressor of mexCD-oprJ operon
MMSSEPAPRQTLQQRVAAAILDGAARIFAIQGEQASMNDVAAAAGVARATVYRYFPNREALLDELASAAVSDVDARLASARIDEVAPEEGIARAVRALVDVGDSFVLLARGRRRSDPERFERKLTEPLRRLFERGQAAGDLRDDIASARLTGSLIGLIVGVLTSTPSLGREDMTATITGLFLDGARARGPRRV